MSWDYADLSKAASEAGGPKKYLEQLEKNSREIGRLEGQESMQPWLKVAVGAGVAIGIGGAALFNKVKNHIKAKKEEKQRGIDEAKEELIKGIEAYDKGSSDDDQE